MSQDYLPCIVIGGSTLGWWTSWWAPWGIASFGHCPGQCRRAASALRWKGCSSNRGSTGLGLAITNPFYILYKILMSTLSTLSMRNSLLSPLKNIQFQNRSPRRSKLQMTRFDIDLNASSNSIESPKSSSPLIKVITPFLIPGSNSRRYCLRTAKPKLKYPLSLPHSPITLSSGIFESNFDTLILF